MSLHEPQPAQRISRRQVFFLHGYDQRGISGYYRLFTADFKRFAQLWGHEASVSAASATDHGSTIWETSVELETGSVSCSYEYLGWENLVIQDISAPAWKLIIKGLCTGSNFIFSGYFRRILHANWRYGLFCIWPFIFLILLLLTSLSLGIMSFLLIDQISPDSPLFSIMAGIIGALIAGALLWTSLKINTGSPLHLTHALVLRLFGHDYARRKRPDIDNRLDALAVYLCKRLAETDAEEFLLIGHSAGSYLAIDLLSKMLLREPDLFQKYPSFHLVTLGGSIPVVALHHDAHWFRANLINLASAPGFKWTEFRARWDWLNFHGYDLGLLTGNKKLPKVHNIKAAEVLAPNRLKSWRYNFFRRHMQYLRASDRQGHYDYFSMICGCRTMVDRQRTQSNSKMAPE